MSADPFHLNRPVHLARRDVFYLKAVQQIRELSAHKNPVDQRMTAEKALFLLREACCHAEAANRSEKTSSQSRLFVEFLDAIVDNTQSLTRMLRRRLAVEPKENALDHFLDSSDTGTKMSGHYRRCAGLILKGLQNILHLAEKPVHDLQQTSLMKMSLTDKARYEKAYQHFDELADSEAEKAVEQLRE